MGTALSAGAPLPDRSGFRWHKVIGPQGMTPLGVTFLCDTFTGFWLHWDGRNVPCEGEDSCKRCKAGMGTRWTGYAAVWCENTNDIRIVCLTEGAARQLLPYLTKHGSLRGLTFNMRRENPKPNAPVKVTPRGQRLADRLPEDFDLMPHLHRLWNVTERFQYAGARRITRKEDLPPNEYLKAPPAPFTPPADDPLA